MEALVDYFTTGAALVGVVGLCTLFYLRLKILSVSKLKSKEISEVVALTNEIVKASTNLDRPHSNELSDLYSRLKILVGLYKTGFSRISKSECRVTIKVFTTINDGNIGLVTVVKDSYYESRYGDKDRITYAGDDTAASFILSGNRYFLQNDLSKSTPSNKYYAHSLPYYSLLVVPIPKNNTSILSEPKQLVGLLIITSNKKIAFDPQIDVTLAERLVENISPMLEEYIRMRSISNMR